jgi:hypothetical protein
MRTTLYRWALPGLVLAVMPALALASRPLKVDTAGGKSQIVIMCPLCGVPIACAKAGDYTLAFSAELQDPEDMGVARLTVRVTDTSGAPVNGLKVTVRLWMGDHEHSLPPLTARSFFSKGEYWATTGHLQMNGVWNAEVSITTPGGDVVKQAFTFSK